jgi:hypothetical protein
MRSRRPQPAASTSSWSLTSTTSTGGSAQRTLDQFAHAATGAAPRVERRYADGRLALGVRGDARGVLALVDGRLTGGRKPIDEHATSVLTARVSDVSSTKAATISDHLLNAAQNKPGDDAPLDIRTEYDESGAHLLVRLTGSLFATTYLLFLVHLPMTQSRT